MNDIEQQLAEAEAKVARLKIKANKLKNGQKIVLGGAVMSAMGKNREFAITIIEMLEVELTRKIDIDRLAPIVEQNKKKIADNNNYPNQETAEEQANRLAIEP